MASFEIKNLTFAYPEAKKQALCNINLKIDQGTFFVLCGKSGCGKSTLLRHFKAVLTPHGARSGEVFLDTTPLPEVDLRTQASKIGYVMQNPDNQIVTDKVLHDLAFGLDSLGYDTSVIRLRVAEMASFFGIQDWFTKSVTELSGGQKQLLNLASVMAMQPDILILDEPTSQLDPIAASEFLAAIQKINRELGTTIMLSEHRLDEVVPMADIVAVMDKGTVIVNAPPREAGLRLKEQNSDMFAAMPAPMQICAAVQSNTGYPLTVREGRSWLHALFKNKVVTQSKISSKEETSHAETAVHLKDVWFKYDRQEPDVIKDLSLEVKKGEFYCIVGGNGTGKTTALTLVSGINKPYRGKVLLGKKPIEKYSSKELYHHNLGMLPQNPQSLFVKKTVELDLYETVNALSPQEQSEKVQAVAKLVEIEDLLSMHPYDLSGGEQQRAALAKVLLLEPTVLLLDEPTKGLDTHFKNKLAQILKKLLNSGVTIVMVSHDIEFCAKYADRCALFFDGTIVTVGTPNRFFSGNSFYTTAANRISRQLFENAVTNEDVIMLCRSNLQTE